MTNLRFKQTAMHTGIIIPGNKAVVDEVTGRVTVTEGAIINLDEDNRGLKVVAQSLVDRDIAEFTNSPATHTLALVTPAQEAMPKNAPEGTGTLPVADSVQKHLENQHRLAIQKDMAASQQQAQIQAQVQPVVTPSEVHNPLPPAPVDISTQQPTEEELAAAEKQPDGFPQ